MAKVRDGEVARGSNVDERDGEVENRDRTRIDRRAPSFEVQLSAPWGFSQRFSRVGRVTDGDEVSRIVDYRSQVHEEWIRQDARTKRLALIIGAVLFVAGCQVIVFAPSGRETVAAIVGAAMLVVAAGTAGYRRVWGRAPGISVGAGDSEFTAAAANVTKRKQFGAPKPDAASLRRARERIEAILRAEAEPAVPTKGGDSGESE